MTVRRKKGQKRKRRGSWSGVHPHDKHTRRRMASRYGGEVSLSGLETLCQIIRDGGAVTVERQTRTRRHVIVLNPGNGKFYSVVYSSSSEKIITALPISRSERRLILDRYGVVCNSSGYPMTEVIDSLLDRELMPKILANDGCLLVRKGARWFKLKKDLAGKYIDSPNFDGSDVDRIKSMYRQVISRNGFVLQEG